jgi:outer membrane receptor for ferrienterochelin and colicins
MRIIISVFLVFHVCHILGQTATIFGTVTSNGKPVEFASIYIKKINSGALSNINGMFELKNIPAGDYTVITSCMGFVNDTSALTLSNGEVKSISIKLIETQINLDEVVITGTLKETYISESPVAIEIITPKLFEKNPSPNIFESLSMVNGVRPQMQCNVCNCGDIHINGMEGPYTMVMIDGMPLVSALGSVYGLMGIPNSIIQRVEVLKGPASTLYGSEAVGGLINIITKSTYNAPLFSFDFFGTSYQEFNTDISVKYKLSKRLTGLFSGNYYHFDKRWDINNDNFTDVTLQKRIAGFNKFTYEHKSGNFSNLAIRYYYEDRWGGEMQWDPKFRGGDSIYGESIYTNRIEIIGSSPLDLIGKNLKLQYSFNSHIQNSAYGNTPFLADQIIGFGQVTKNIIKKKHDIMLGTAMRYIYYDDNTVITETESSNGLTSNLPTITYLPGIFIQDEIKLNYKNTALIGLRYDYNSHHGTIFSPRINWKYDMNEFNTLRLGIGNGYRVVNLFSEDHAAFNGAREVVITENLKPEQSWNANLNYSVFKCMGKKSITVDANLFYTYFSNKIVADYFTDHTKVIFDNLHGFGINRGAGVQAHFTLGVPLKISVGVTYTDIYLMEKDTFNNEVKSRQVQTPPFTSNFLVAYKFSKIKTTLDLTGNIYSPMLLPVLPNDFRPDHSPWFCLMNVQITKEIKNNWQVYIGVKNLLNFIPKNPIMRPNDPFDLHVNDPVNNPNGYTFDPGYNYAPVQGIRAFIGVRYKLSNH